jgi:muramoyltetrapeptide carboxypeptidase
MRKEISMKHCFPRGIKPGGKVGIVSPSGPVRDMAQFERGTSVLRKYGYSIVKAPHALERTYHMSATGRQKADDINAMFADPTIEAVFPSVGGHTANQVLEFLDYSLIQSNPKLLFGFSDSSVLINAITARTGLVTVHDNVDVMFGVGRFGDERLATRGEYTDTYLRKVLCSSQSGFTVEALSSWTTLRAGSASGTALGGNLSTLRALIGSPYEPDWSGAVLFLEDRGEPHQWDQQLGHLHLAGVLSRLAALVLGKIDNKPEQFYKENYQPLPGIIQRHCESYDYPIVYGADFGHDVENFPILIGSKVHVDTNRTALTFVGA